MPRWPAPRAAELGSPPKFKSRSRNCNLHVAKCLIKENGSAPPNKVPTAQSHSDGPRWPNECKPDRSCLPCTAPRTEQSLWGSSFRREPRELGGNRKVRDFGNVHCCRYCFPNASTASYCCLLAPRRGSSACWGRLSTAPRINDALRAARAKRWLTL